MPKYKSVIQPLNYISIKRLIACQLFLHMTFSALISHSILLTRFTVNSTTFIANNSRRHANVSWNYNTCKLKLLLFSIWVFSIFFYPCEYISGLYTRTHFLHYVSDFVNICFTAFQICSQPSLTSSQLVYECICVSGCVCVCLRACRTVLCRVMWGACVHCGMSWTVPESELHGPSSSRPSFKAVNTDCAAWSSHALNWRYTHTHQAHISHHREIKQHSYISTTKYIV